MVPRNISQTGPTPQSVPVAINGSELFSFVKRADASCFFHVTRYEAFSSVHSVVSCLEMDEIASHKHRADLVDREVKIRS